MPDDAALRRLISRIRQELIKLPGELKNFAELQRVSTDDDEFDPHETDRAKFFAQYAIENVMYLVQALLQSEPMLADMYAAFKVSLASNLLDHKWHREDWGELTVDFPAQNTIERFFDLAVVALGGVIPDESIMTVDNICKGIGRAVDDLVKRGIMASPTGETPVKHLGFALIHAAFQGAHPDGGVKFMLPGGGSRKPDAAISLLRLCIEFKYANDETELSKCVGEIVDDMSVYGDPRYDIFRAVIYAPYVGASQDRLNELRDQRLKNVSLRFPWEAFLVTATGGRKPRASGKKKDVDTPTPAKVANT